MSGTILDPAHTGCPRLERTAARIAAALAKARQPHLWVMDVRGVRAACVDAMVRNCLADGEVTDLRRLYRDCDRNAYVVAHAGLRFVAAAFLGVAPTRVRFGRAPGGKPYLSAPGRAVPEFSLSHAAGAVAIGFDRSPLGVDIEAIRHHGVSSALVRATLAPDERNDLRRMEPSQHPRGFCRFWARKEAYLKAVGQGLVPNLPAIDCGSSARKSARAVVHGQAGEWIVRSVRLGARLGQDYCAAICLSADRGAWRWRTALSDCSFCRPRRKRVSDRAIRHVVLTKRSGQ